MESPKHTIQEYETFFFDVTLEQFLGIKRSSLTDTPVVKLSEDPGEGLTVFQCRLGWHIRASAKIQPLLADRIRPEDWENICGQPDGLTVLFALCGLGPEDCHTITNTRPKGQEHMNSLCWHNLGLACDTDAFCFQQPAPANIIRVAPGQPLWPSDPPPGCAFIYMALSEGKDIAISHACHKPGSFHDALWAMGVYVRREHWHKGLGKAVAARPTQEVVQMGHIALWNTQADNIASARIAESLGYHRTFCHIKIPKVVIERPMNHDSSSERTAI